MEENKLKIIIADDHRIFRAGLSTSIGLTDFAVLTGKAENGKELLELLVNTPCDIVMMDIRMPLMDGI